MIITEYTKSMNVTLAGLMTDYMRELGCSTPEAVIRGKLSDFIDTMCEKEIIRVSIAFDGEKPAGFSVFQIDAPASDWCHRPGWGFIREFYIVPAYRKHGIGKILAEYTEQELKNMGAAGLYLTSTNAVPFWQKCGWTLTGELTDSDQSIFEKHF